MIKSTKAVCAINFTLCYSQLLLRTMKIEMQKRKAGIYAQWFSIDGLSGGKRTTYLIYANQAKTYAQAVRFWNKTWGGRNGNKAFVLRNAEPYNPSSYLAC